MIQTIKNHPYISATAAGLTALVIGSAITSERYSTLAHAVVLDEQYISQADEKKPPHYLLYLQILDGKDKGEVYTLQVVEEKVPLAVLDAIIGTGTELYLPLREKGIFFTAPTPLYPVARFGQVPSNDIRVLHSWESSEKVKKKFESELDARKKREYEQAGQEAETHFYGTIIY